MALCTQSLFKNNNQNHNDNKAQQRVHIKSDWISPLFHIDLLPFIYLFLVIFGNFWCHTEIRYKHTDVSKRARVFAFNSIRFNSIVLPSIFNLYCHQINGFIAISPSSFLEIFVFFVSTPKERKNSRFV